MLPVVTEVIDQGGLVTCKTSVASHVPPQANRINPFSAACLPVKPGPVPTCSLPCCRLAACLENRSFRC